MFAIVTRRVIYSCSSRFTSSLLISWTRMSTLYRHPSVRSLSLTPIYHNSPNMQQMMDEISKNPKAMALLEALKKDPKLMQAVQDLMMTMSRKGYIDLNNPMKQPSKSKFFFIKHNFRSLFQTLLFFRYGYACRQ